MTSVEVCEYHKELIEKIDKIYAAIVGGVDEHPGILERMRKVEDLVSKVKFWSYTVVTLLVTNLIGIVGRFLYEFLHKVPQ